jgi:hypothetical protein
MVIMQVTIEQYKKKEITNVMCRPHQDNNIHTPYYVNVPTKRHQ